MVVLTFEAVNTDIFFISTANVEQFSFASTKSDSSNCTSSSLDAFAFIGQVE